MHTVYMQIFRNNLSRGLQLYYQILMIAKVKKTEIGLSDNFLKHKKIKFLLSESHQKLFSTCAG